MPTNEQGASESVPPTGPASTNPLGGLNIVVSVPHSIEIRMVDASALADYEVWFFLSSILSGAVVGFAVATIQAFDSNANNARQLEWTMIIFSTLFIVTTITTFVKRYQLKKQGRSIQLRTIEAIGLR